MMPVLFAASPRSPRSQRRRLGPLLATALVLLALSALTGCAPTKGTSTAFKPQETTNTDFAPPEFVPLGNYPHTLDITPKTGTAALVAAANELDNTVTVLQNDGLGNLTQVALLSTGTHPGQVLFGDFDAAGNADLAVVNGNLLDTVSVYLNAGGTTWGPPASYPLGGLVAQMAVVDVDADGLDDIVATVPGLSEIVVLHNDGGGTFSLNPTDTASSAPTPGRFVVGDFNGTGGPDLAVLHSGSNVVSIWLDYDPATGTYGAPPTPVYGVAVSPTNLVTAELNGDAFNDLAVSSPGTNVVTVLTGDGSGAFNPLLPAVEANTNPGLPVAGAFHPPQSGDDLVVPNPGQEYITFLNNAGGGTFGMGTLTTTLNPVQIVTGNFDGDSANHLDLIVAEEVKRALGVFAGDGAGGFYRTVIGLDSVPTFLIRTDINGDGNDNDLLLLMPNTDRMVKLVNVHP